MRRHDHHRVLVCVSVWLGWLFLAPAVYAQSPAESVRGCLAEMHRWLGGSAYAQSWREFLLSDELLRQIERGEDADREAVRQVLERYSHDLPTLQKDKFVAVREALRQWVETLQEVQVEQLPEAARQATAEFQPLGEDDVLAARRQLEESLRQVERLLGQAAERDRQGWKTYLDLDALRGELQKPAPDVNALGGVWRKFYENQPGLEFPAFLDLRQDLYDFMNAATFVAPEVQEAYSQQLNDLAARLEAYQQKGDRADGAAIGGVLDWLRRARQARPLIRAVRRRYGQPNVYGQASARLVAAGLRDDAIDRVSDVRENILGTAVRGQAHLRGKLDVALIPNDRQAEIELRLSGLATTDNVGHNRGVRIYSTGQTTVHALKTLYLDRDGIHDQPASAACDTDTRLNGVGAKCGLIEKVAWKRAQQSLPAAERIASRRAERRVEDQVNDQADELVQDSNSRLRQRILDPLRRRDAMPEQFHVRSSASDVLVTILASNPRQISTSDRPPAVGGNPDLSLQLHETAVANYSESLLANRTITDAEVRKFLEDNDREVPEELRADREPWSITFDAVQPVIADFRGETLRFALRGRRFTRSDNVLRERAEISASYALQPGAEGKSVLQRQGDVVVNFVDQESLSVKNLTFKTFLESKFRNLFKEQIPVDDLELPGRWSKAGKLALEHLSSDGGWLTAAWRQGEAELKTASLAR